MVSWEWKSNGWNVCNNKTKEIDICILDAVVNMAKRPPKVSRALEAADASQNQRKSTKKRKVIIKRMRK